MPIAVAVPGDASWILGDVQGRILEVAAELLVLAIEQDAKVDVLHACGGNARCT